MDDSLYPRVFIQSPIPFILAGGTAGGSSNQFTMGNNGALSTLPTLPTTYSGGAWIYMPANGIFAGSTAGWYWFVASSTTAGTVYNNTYTSGDPKPAVPASPTAFATTGPGVVTQTTSAVDAWSVTIPGGAIGPSGRLVIDSNVQALNNANAKSFSTLFGSAALASPSMASQTARRELRQFANVGAQNRNKYQNGWAPAIDGTVGYSTVDTSAEQVLKRQLTLSTTTDYLVDEMFQVSLVYGA